MLRVDGHSKAVMVNSSVLVLRLIRRYAGLDSNPCDGVPRSSSVANNTLMTDRVHTLHRDLFADYTAGSAFPLALLLYEQLVMGEMYHHSPKLADA